MKKLFEQIRSVHLFSCLSDEEIGMYINEDFFRSSVYGKGQLIHLEGELCSKLEVISSGEVTVDRIDEDGDLMTVSRLYKDDILGGSLVFSSSPYYPMTVTAQQDTCILEIDDTRLLELLEKNSAFLKLFLRFVSDRTHTLGKKIKNTVGKTVRQKIISYLKIEHELQKTVDIKLRTSKKALAEKFGISRTSLSRELSKMKTEGLITYDNTSISILDPGIYA